MITSTIAAIPEGYRAVTALLEDHSRSASARFELFAKLGVKTARELGLNPDHCQIVDVRTSTTIATGEVGASHRVIESFTVTGTLVVRTNER